MAQKCVFCGEKPINKNKEHIIPKWLIKMTGDPNRQVLIWKDDEKELKFSWMKYAFPSCEKCNSEFADREAIVKDIVIKLLNENQISQKELNLFLDWVDKIRVGIWLGHNQLLKRDIDPNFHINQRIGSKDRLCLLYKKTGEEKGINLMGIDSEIFEVIPSCFAMTINNLIIFSYSKEFILSKNLGFPFPSNYSYQKNFLVKATEIVAGTSTINFPIIQGKIIKPAIRLYQSIYKGVHFYKRPYAGASRKFLQLNALRFDNKLIQSNIYIIDEMSERNYFWKNKKKYNLRFIDKIDDRIANYAIAQMVYEHQNHSAEECFMHIDDLNDIEKKEFMNFYQPLIDRNKTRINKLNEMLSPIYRNI